MRRLLLRLEGKAMGAFVTGVRGGAVPCGVVACEFDVVKRRCLRIVIVTACKREGKNLSFFLVVIEFPYQKSLEDEEVEMPEFNEGDFQDVSGEVVVDSSDEDTVSEDEVLSEI
ncbi:hypothetical protein TSUD_296860 [Trifolium subterraneum]|uniref:Uncharacterized protein n=1 Tax=Trifolium subterraneum TaxID=3900 RepID=A0A2Z6PGC0_TRISU|nr:hypothetical protein TSUD_296860 [Trifolium subterraneum]